MLSINLNDKDYVKGEKIMKIILEKSKTGIPCLWERGGGYRNTGNSRIIADKNGEPKKPLYIRNRGELANGDHALIPVNNGDYIIMADHHRNDFNVYIYKIIEINSEENGLTAVTKLINRYSEWQWDKARCEIPYEMIETAIEAAIGKATCYHCREPHYIKG